MNPKRTAKSLALDFARISRESVSRSLLGVMKIGFELPSSNVRYPGGTSAAACISVDYDHFGNVSKDPLKFEPGADSNKLALNRAGTRVLLDLAERHSLPMTWAICGKTAEADINSYKRIVGSEAGHEIGIHTYSHIDVSSCSESELQHEVSKCVEVLKLGHTPRTFIFPWNRSGHFEQLKQMGFTTFRGKERVVGSPKLDNGLWNIPPVFYLDTKSLGAYELVRKFVDLCVEKHSVFHLWTHPWSVVYPDSSDALADNLLEPLFAYLEAKRNAGQLSISTLGEISSVMQDGGSTLNTNPEFAPVGAF